MSAEEILNLIIQFVSKYFIVVIILGAFAFLSAFFVFWNNAIRFFKSISNGIIWILKILWWILKNLFILIFKKIIFEFIILKSIKFVKNIIRKFKLKRSKYNIRPVKYHFNIIGLIFNYKLRKELKYRYNAIEACERTHDLIDKKFSYITMIEASVGGGKTSFMNGYSHYRTVLFKERIEKLIVDTETHFKDFSFIELRKIIREEAIKGSSESDVLSSVYKNKAINDKFNNTIVYSNYISQEPAPEILKSYCVAYLAELRNNFVLSNYRLYNRITNSYNYEIDDNFLNIKSEEDRKKFYLPSYSLIVEDEKALSLYKNTSDYRKLNDSGADVTLRLFRQLRNETTYYITATQNTSRLAVLFRELANSYIQIQSSSIVGNLPNWQRRQDKKEKKIFKKAIKKAKKKEIKRVGAGEQWLHRENNSFKKKLFKLWDKRKQVTSCGFIKYKILIASKLDDLKDHSENARNEELTLTFPLTWCYGVYRTCEYSDFYDYLSKESDIKSPDQLKQITSLYSDNESKFKYILATKEDTELSDYAKTVKAKMEIRKKIKEEAKELEKQQKEQAKKEADDKKGAEKNDLPEQTK